MVKKLITALSTLMAFALLVFLNLATPVYAATSSLEHLIALDDLPSGFIAASASEAEDCQWEGTKDVFVLKKGGQVIESICVTSSSLKNGTDNELGLEMAEAFFDAMLQNPKELMKQANPEDIAGVEILTNLPPVGDAIAAFTKAAGVERSDFAIFRRGDIINSLAVSYVSGKTPAMSLQDLASKVDQRVVALSESRATQVAVSEPIAQSATTTQPHQITAQVGQVIDQGMYSLIINAVEEGETYSPYLNPDSGNHYVAVDLTIASKADEGVSVNEFNAVLKDSEGYQYRPTYTGKDPQLGAENDLPLGDKVRGWITFEVPDSAEGLMFEYHPFNLKRAIRVALS